MNESVDPKPTRFIVELRDQDEADQFMIEAFEFRAGDGVLAFVAYDQSYAQYYPLDIVRTWYTA